MSKREFYLSIAIYAILSAGLIASKYIFEYNLDWLLIFVIIFVGYLFLRYRLTTPIQRFSKKYNMLVDYDLDMDAAIDLCLDHIEQAPTRGIKALYQVHLGMAYYNNGEFDQALQTFKEIELKKLNPVYHVLIYAHEAYIYNELGQKEEFEIALEKIRAVKSKINKKYIGYANSYERMISVIGNLEEDPEEYKQGYISQRLVYHYRLAKYYEQIGDEREMDIHLAKVLANGKGHFTAKEAQKMFKNTVDIDDYVFTDEDVENLPVDEVPEEEDFAEPKVLEEPEGLDVFDDVVEKEDEEK